MFSENKLLFIKEKPQDTWKIEVFKWWWHFFTIPPYIASHHNKWWSLNDWLTTHLIKDVYYVQFRKIAQNNESFVLNLYDIIFCESYSCWNNKICFFFSKFEEICQKFIKYSRVIWNMLFNLNDSNGCSWVALINSFSCQSHIIDRITYADTLFQNHICFKVGRGNSL